ncbi:MAG: TonB family protein, partial [Myxococcota bacterium]
VDIPPSPDDRPPEQADYLSEHNTRTERQTRSRHQAQTFENALNEPSVTEHQKMSSPQPAQETTALEIGPETQDKAAEDKQKTGPQQAFELPNIKPQERLALKLDPTTGILRNQPRRESVDGKSDRLKLSLGKDDPTQPSQRGSAPNKGLTMADLMPEIGVLARLNGAPANDHLEGLEEGEGTFLNSKEFKYASFFNRMKRGVSQHWHPINEYRRRDPSGNIYGHRSRITVLNVTLKPDGSLQGVDIKRSSGVDFLDQEAMSAFHRAGPFPNPPKGLVDANGLIIFPFGFHLDISSRGGPVLPF